MRPAVTFAPHLILDVAELLLIHFGVSLTILSWTLESILILLQHLSVPVADIPRISTVVG